MQAAKTVDLKEGDALLAVDIQNCFLPGGSLGVAGGEEINGQGHLAGPQTGLPPV